MIKCIIVDDEKPARDEIAYLLEKNEQFKVIGAYDSGKTLLENIKFDIPDVLFIDVNMPSLTGIEVVEMIREEAIGVHVVFITAYDDYAIKAFDLNAIDYLLKPVSQERMDTCLSRIAEHLDEHNEDKLGELLLQLSKGKKEHVCLHKAGKLVPVKLDDIIFVKAENKGSIIETTKGSFISSTPLQDFEKKLFDNDFFRCHRSYLINLSFITHIEPWFNRTYQVELEGVEEKIPISRNYVQNFKDLMNII